jgi:DNA-directed RNA polymerase subunit RPC12/RpoP
MLAEPEPLIRYTCPRCLKPLEAPVSSAGQKSHCRECSQRLQIPQPYAPPPPAINKTILAVEEKR